MGILCFNAGFKGEQKSCFFYAAYVVKIKALRKGELFVRANHDPGSALNRIVDAFKNVQIF